MKPAPKWPYNFSIPEISSALKLKVPERDYHLKRVEMIEKDIRDLHDALALKSSQGAKKP
jgi:hypothetical protein